MRILSEHIRKLPTILVEDGELLARRLEALRRASRLSGSSPSPAGLPPRRPSRSAVGLRGAAARARRVFHAQVFESILLARFLATAVILRGTAGATRALSKLEPWSSWGSSK